MWTREPIRAALAARSAEDARATERFKRVESWRERLLAEGAPALAELTRWRPDIDQAEWARRVSAAQSERARSGARRRGLAGVVSRFAHIVRYNALMQALVGIIMGSSSDWETMQSAAEVLDKLGDRVRGARRVRAPHA